MRNDPPFDMQYITATYILERCRASVINNPCSIRNFPEKFIDYKEYIPKTLISQNFFYITEFCSQVYPFIVKPLYDFGGSSVAKFNSFCKSAQEYIQKLISLYKAPIIVQEFCQQVIEQGDKRIIVLDGKILGHFARVNQKKDFIVNMCCGGIAKPCKLTSVENDICQKIAKNLKEKDIMLAGIDMIGEKVTEINVTSIAGIAELEEIYSINASKLCLDCFLGKTEKMHAAYK
jgi:glutathione synthase